MDEDWAKEHERLSFAITWMTWAIGLMGPLLLGAMIFGYTVLSSRQDRNEAVTAAFMLVSSDDRRDIAIELKETIARQNAQYDRIMAEISALRVVLDRLADK